MKIIWIDTETTGLDYTKNCIIQLSGIIEIDGKVKESFDFKCRPLRGKIIDDEALAIQKRSKLEVVCWSDPKETYLQFTKILSKYVNKFDSSDKFVIAGHNVKFDIDFLNQFFKGNGDNYFGSYFKWNPIDTMSLVVIMERLGLMETPKSYKLDLLCEMFKIEKSDHDAMNDITATRKIGNIMLKKLIEKQGKKRQTAN